jgi:hypothetical protein
VMMGVAEGGGVVVGRAGVGRWVAVGDACPAQAARASARTAVRGELFFKGISAWGTGGIQIWKAPSL